MRKMLLLAVLAFAATLTATAQEHPNGRFERRDSTRIAEPFVLPDTIVHMTPWMPSYDVMAPIGSKPVVSMTSVVLAPKSKLPARVSVFDASPRQLVRHVTISNGQAWNWSPYPDAYLDARTLSFPMPR
jgi:hypothetical protein